MMMMVMVMNGNRQKNTNQAKNCEDGRPRFVEM
jgi:hypothetical protein